MAPLTSLRGFGRRTREIHAEVAALADIDPGWWLLAAGVALVEPIAPPEVYLACDAEPDGDTLMGFTRRGIASIAEAIAYARAARTALRELDGLLPDQPLAVTVSRATGAALRPSSLDVAAFAIGNRVVTGALDDPHLEERITAGEPWSGATPFVCVSLGDEPFETARHGHRRAWTSSGGPWLGIGHSGALTIVSTCHLVVDGYGHARITARIADLVEGSGADRTWPSLAPVPGGAPLAIAWAPLACPTPRVLPLAYELGRILHRDAGVPSARFSPTIQIPVARGRLDDPDRLRRRIVSATTSVRFEHGEIEPLAVFEARTRGVLVREAASAGLVSRMLAAARAVPVPLAWKRRSIGSQRSRWLDGIAEVLGGRALLSRIAVDAASPPLCAVSTPSRTGSAVITIVDDGTHGAITICGTGATRAFLDELLGATTADQ